MQKKVTLKSGHQLTVNSVPATPAKRLKRLVAAELARVKIQFSDGLVPALFSKDRTALLTALGGTEVNTLKDLFLNLVASEEIETAAIDCMQKWLLEGEAVKAETFDRDDLRGDLILCEVEVARYGLLPFFEHLGSLFEIPSNPEEKSSPK